MDDAVLNAFLAFLERESWPHQIESDGALVRMRFRGRNGEWNVIAQMVGDDRQKLVCYSLPAVVVGEGRRLAAADLVARLNFGMVLGNFELDMDSGRVRYKTSADLRGTEPQVRLIEHLVFTNMMMTDRYLPAIEGVAWRGAQPRDALAQIESMRLAEERAAAAVADAEE